MATDLKVFGPFPMPYDESGRIKRVTPAHRRNFWSSTAVAHLGRKHGCFVFALKASQGFTPWYVGKTKEGFEQETFAYHKLTHYNSVLFAGRKGKPVLFFVGPDGNLNKVPIRELNHMEKELIQFALRKNSNLANVQNTKNIPKWTVHGVIRSPKGAPTEAEKKFRKMMKIG